jgi:hypothetical protein
MTATNGSGAMARKRTCGSVDAGGQAMGILRGRGPEHSTLVSYGPNEATRVVDLAVDDACVYWVTTNDVPSTGDQTRQTSMLHAIAR